MAILFKSISEELTEFEYNGETVVNKGVVVIAETLEEAVNYEATSV